ncbi:transketolase [Candidatus Uhrbacteria bacterium]|nr:transketolase [Candidatus Uhrbacteria bacterium]
MSGIDGKTAANLQKIANEIRKDIIRMTNRAGSGHPGGALGMADVLTALYFHILRHDPKRPDWPERDRLILSNGHICPVLYASLARSGYFPAEELVTLRQFGSRLQGHPERGHLPGIESASGPLGAGLAQAVGLALAAKADGAEWRPYCLTSDGEHDAGPHWEAVLFAGSRGIGNLTMLVDRNSIQLDGPTEKIMPLEPLAEKYRAFGWNVTEIDGHDFSQVIGACEGARAVADRPTAVICRTVLGKGVSFMENDHRWHGQAPNDEQAAQALRELAPNPPSPSSDEGAHANR